MPAAPPPPRRTPPGALVVPPSIPLGHAAGDKEDGTSEEEEEVRQRLEEDPLYDSEADEADEAWFTRHKLTGSADGIASAPPHHMPPTPSQASCPPSASPSASPPPLPLGEAERELLDSLPTDGTLSCPLCFEPITYWCQRHASDPGRYRALLVQGCMVLFTRTVEPDAPTSIGNADDVEDEAEAERNAIYHPVQCANCECEVGVFQSNAEVYHFHHVILSN